MRTFICFVSILAATGHAGAAPTPIPTYGAITYSMSLQKSFHGVADSMVLAEADALKLCIQAGANDCNTAIWVHNGYVSVAVDISSPNRQNSPWGTGWGSTQADAEYWARRGCESHGGTNCTPTTWSTNPQQSAEGGPGPTPSTPPVPIPYPVPTPTPPPPAALTAQQQAQLRDLLNRANSEKKVVSCAIYVGKISTSFCCGRFKLHLPLKGYPPIYHHLLGWCRSILGSAILLIWSIWTWLNSSNGQCMTHCWVRRALNRRSIAHRTRCQNTSRGFLARPNPFGMLFW